MNGIKGFENASGSVPLSAHPPISLNQFMEQSGLAPSTVWKYRNLGWLKTIVIAGRHYVTREEIANFNARAARGDFAGKIKKPPGRGKK